MSKKVEGAVKIALREVPADASSATPPFPDTDLSLVAQRTIKRMMEEGEDEGGEDFLTLLEQASKPDQPPE